MFGKKFCESLTGFCTGVVEYAASLDELQGNLFKREQREIFCWRERVSTREFSTISLLNQIGY